MSLTARLNSDFLRKSFMTKKVKLGSKMIHTGLKSVSTLALATALAFAGFSAQARTVDHAMGTTEVPDAPQRIVILTNEGTEALVDLGVIPVGAVQSWDGDPFYDHFEGQLDGVEVLGTENAVNLELIAALEPDLILGNKVRQEAIYEQLSAIAPTVFSENLSGDWQINYMTYAETLGIEDEAQARLDAFQARTEALADALGDSVNEEISLVRFSPNRNRIYYKDTFAGTILDQVGFARPEAQDKDEFAEQVTMERIPEMDGDRIFYFSYDGDVEFDANLNEWTTDPTWLGLEAVQAGNAHRVSEVIWNTAGGIIAANIMLTELAAIYDIELP